MEITVKLRMRGIGLTVTGEYEAADPSVGLTEGFAVDAVVVEDQCADISPLLQGETLEEIARAVLCQLADDARDDPVWAR